VAKESRKQRRNAAREGAPSGKEKRAQLTKPLTTGGAQEPVDPFGSGMLKNTILRVALILGAVWLVGGLIAGISQSTLTSQLALGAPAVITLVVLGVVIWTVRRTKAAREVADVLRGVETEEQRQQALAKLDADGKKNDPAKIFAKAQLQMQQDPKLALATLEEINLTKVVGSVADEARSQRAMIHLTLGQVNLARQLVDNVELKRHQDARSRAMIGAIAAEAWARSGESKKALETLELFDLSSEELTQLKPQLLRSFAFAYAHANKSKDLKRILRQMVKIDARLLGGFLQGKSHPILQKEAKRMLEQSGAVPRRMQVQRMR
jgi:hypothetical protein